MKILLLEDDYLYNITIKDFLISNGYSVDDFEDGQEALDAIYDNNYNVLLLDIRVPSLDGFEILKKIRAENIDTPAIILTSLTDIDDLSRGYELGCSDYLRKPFELKELKYRLDQVVKLHSFSTSKNLIDIYDDYQFDIKKNILFKDNKAIDLSLIEIKLVSFLIQNKGFYVSNDTLQEYVWEGKDITYADIRMCITRVRQKCGKEFIKTKKMVGYKIG